MTALTTNETSINTHTLSKTKLRTGEVFKKEVETIAITIDDLDYLMPYRLGAAEVISGAFMIQPSSFIISFVLFLLGTYSLLTFIFSDTFFVHPYISLGLIVVGLGILLTMIVASKSKFK